MLDRRHRRTDRDRTIGPDGVMEVGCSSVFVVLVLAAAVIGFIQAPEPSTRSPLIQALMREPGRHGKLPARRR